MDSSSDRMTVELTGLEPLLSGAIQIPQGTGDEPSLGGEHRVKLVRDHVLRMLENPATTPLRRAAIGDWLDSTGDPRPGVGLDGDGFPDLMWCPVDSGEVLLNDLPDPVQVRRFYLARYPVTWAQYRIFLEAEDGHRDLRWWEGLRRRPEYEREADLRDNQPAQEVSWYDAIAYCRWLSAHTDYDVRLPTEAEWQLAATGGDSDLLFPWGRDAGRGHLGYANTRESLLRRATAVGMYPSGESPVGALDMAGTVLEWCSDDYPGVLGADKELLERRVLRGGSWFLILNYARTTFRTANDPYFRFNSVGFRLAADSLEPRPRPVVAPVAEVAEDDAAPEPREGEEVLISNADSFEGGLA